MDKLTEEQHEQVDRLLLLHYARGMAAAAKHIAESFDSLGFTLEVALKSLQELTAEIVDINEKDKEQYGRVGV